MFFKITKSDECHHGYQYQTGLNILDKPFQKEGSCVAGGLYFTTLEHLDQFYEYGVWLRAIIIPDDALIVKDPDGNKWRADKIILGEKYSLFDVETIQKFNLKITERYIDLASSHGQVKILDWCRDSKDVEFKYSSYAIDGASKNGHVEVLEWWLKAHNESGLKLKYGLMSLGWASGNNLVHILDWWLKASQESGLELLYSNEVMNLSSLNGHVEILDWWLKAHNEHGLELTYSSNAMNWASHNSHVKILDWWKNSGLKLKYTSINCWVNNKSVLEWWKSSGLVDV